MKIGFKKLTLYFVFVFFIVSCKSNGTQSSSLRLPTETATNFPARISETSTPTPTIVSPTTTIRPTLETDKTFEYTVGLLRTNNLCDLPCFWTVTPGEPWSSARQRLNYFVPFISDTPQNGSATLHEISSNVGIGKLGVSFIVSILEKNNVVESVSAQLMSENFAESLETFTPQEIFSTYGAPEMVLLFVSNDSMEPKYQFFHLWLVYEAKGFYILYSGYTLRNDDMFQICPVSQHFELEGYSDKYGSVEFGSVLGKDENTLKNFMSNRFAPIDFVYSNSRILETVTDFSNDEFAKLFLANGMACFDTPAKVWKTQTK